MAEKEKLTGNDVCVCLHTALRKYCDSKITSAAYNLIHLLCDDTTNPEQSPWHILGDLVAERINQGVEDAELVLLTRAAVDRLDDVWFDRVVEPARKEGMKEPRKSRLQLYALQCTLQCFSADDWVGFVHLLKE